MDSLVQSVNYSAINTADTTKNGFYVIMFISEVYTLQNNTTIYGQIISAGGLFVRVQYICSIQEINNWYWKPKTLQQNITVTKRTILHQCIDVVGKTDVQDIIKMFVIEFKKKSHTKTSYLYNRC